MKYLIVFRIFENESDFISTLEHYMKRGLIKSYRFERVDDKAVLLADMDENLFYRMQDYLQNVTEVYSVVKFTYNVSHIEVERVKEKALKSAQVAKEKAKVAGAKAKEYGKKAGEFAWEHREEIAQAAVTASMLM